jgi:hypothetical protein
MENIQGHNRLPTLAIEIKTHLADARHHHMASVTSAIEAGSALLEAKALLPHGQWLGWLKDNCGLSVRVAQNYMRVARNRDALKNESDSYSAALEAVAKEADPFGGMEEWEVMAEVRAAGKALLAEVEARLAVATDVQEVLAVAELCKHVIEGEVERINRAQLALGALTVR